MGEGGRLRETIFPIPEGFGSACDTSPPGQASIAAPPLPVKLGMESYKELRPQSRWAITIPGSGELLRIAKPKL